MSAMWIRVVSPQQFRQQPGPQEYRDDVVRFAREVLRWEPDAKQSEILQQRKWVAMNWARRCGKSSTVAVKIVHQAVCFPETDTLLVSCNRYKLGELFHLVDKFLWRLPADWSCRARQVPGLGGMGRRLQNGSRILGGTTDPSVRGPVSSLVVFDEAADVKDNVFWAAAASILIKKAPIWTCGTPNGKQGWFRRLWNDETNRQRLEDQSNAYSPWFLSQYRGDECPRMRMESGVLEELRRRLGETRFRREYCCEFLQDEATDLVRQTKSKAKSLPRRSPPKEGQR